MSERDYLYDNVKGLLIITVVLCHLLGCCIAKQDLIPRSLVVFIYYFHMPLFIFISGFFSKNVEKCRETAFRNLFLVYVVAQVFWVIFKYLTNGSVHYIRHFLDPGYAIWYIVALFFWRLFLKDLIRIPHILLISFLVSPLIMFLSDAELVLAINKTVGFLFFFLLGYCAGPEHVAKVRRLPRPLAIALLAAIYAATVMLMKAGILSYGGAKSLLLHTMNMASFDSVWLGLGLYYGALAMAVLTGGLVLAAMPAKKNFLAYIGGDTLPLYLSHTYFLILCDMLFAAVSLPHGAEYAVVLSLCVLLVAVFSTPLYRRAFHGVYGFLIGLICPKSAQKKSPVS